MRINQPKFASKSLSASDQLVTAVIYGASLSLSGQQLWLNILILPVSPK
jgi:hypothetical protein